MVNCFMGVDPGLSGAVAFYFPNQPDKIAAYDVPIVDNEINCSALTQIIQQFEPDWAIIEEVGAMPKQGVSSTFKFGCSYGMVRGVVGALMIKTTLVRPAKWKKHFALAAEKEKSRERAIQFWPRSEAFQRKKDHGRAEAALLARYGSDLLIK
jgi:crossover junction endodeoxyribonuclease RuvC